MKVYSRKLKASVFIDGTNRQNQDDVEATYKSLARVFFSCRDKFGVRSLLHVEHFDPEECIVSLRLTDNEGFDRSYLGEANPSSAALLNKSLLKTALVEVWSIAINEYLDLDPASASIGEEDETSSDGEKAKTEPKKQTETAKQAVSKKETPHEKSVEPPKETAPVTEDAPQKESEAIADQPVAKAEADTAKTAPVQAEEKPASSEANKEIASETSKTAQSPTDESVPETKTENDTSAGSSDDAGDSLAPVTEDTGDDEQIKPAEIGDAEDAAAEDPENSSKSAAESDTDPLASDNPFEFKYMDEDGNIQTVTPETVMPFAMQGKTVQTVATSPVYASYARACRNGVDKPGMKGAFMRCITAVYDAHEAERKKAENAE